MGETTTGRSGEAQRAAWVWAPETPHSFPSPSPVPAARSRDPDGRWRPTVSTWMHRTASASHPPRSPGGHPDPPLRGALPFHPAAQTETVISQESPLCSPHLHTLGPRGTAGGVPPRWTQTGRVAKGPFAAPPIRTGAGGAEQDKATWRGASAAQPRGRREGTITAPGRTPEPPGGQGPGGLAYTQRENPRGCWEQVQGPCRQSHTRKAQRALPCCPATRSLSTPPGLAHETGHPARAGCLHRRGPARAPVPALGPRSRPAGMVGRAGSPFLLARGSGDGVPADQLPASVRRAGPRGPGCEPRP